MTRLRSTSTTAAEALERLADQAVPIQRAEEAHAKRQRLGADSDCHPGLETSVSAVRSAVTESLQNPGPAVSSAASPRRSAAGADRASPPPGGTPGSGPRAQLPCASQTAGPAVHACCHQAFAAARQAGHQRARPRPGDEGELPADLPSHAGLPRPFSFATRSTKPPALSPGPHLRTNYQIVPGHRRRRGRRLRIARLVHHSETWLG
ncbi:MAG: hypothetical protein MZW92_07640 [Comamonadaceae bacterium]|nr:hypothetical protein [Comamonadaceae bacterium]